MSTTNSKKPKFTLGIANLLEKMPPISVNNIWRPSTENKKKKKRKNEYIVQARRVLRGEKWTAERLKVLYTSLRRDNKFNYARKIVQRLREDFKLHKDIHLCQEHAMCAYKDESLPPDVRFDLAIKILKSAFNLETTTNCRTLGMMGTIYKRKWQHDNQSENLERSLMYFNAGYEQWQKNIEENKNGGDGYCAINTAFILDLLASNKITAKLSSNGRADIINFSKRAQEVRTIVIKELTDKEDRGRIEKYWRNVTLAQAHFGLFQYQEAKKYLKEAKIIVIEQELVWQYKNTASQLATLVDIQIRMFNDYKRYGLQKDKKQQSVIESILTRTKLIPHCAFIVSCKHLSNIILKNNADTSGLAIDFQTKDQEEYKATLEEMISLSWSYFEADHWIDTTDPIMEKHKLEKKKLSSIIRKIKNAFKRQDKNLDVFLKIQAESISNLLAPSLDNGEEKINSCLLEVVDILKKFPELIEKDFPFFTAKSAAINVQKSLVDHQLNEKATQLIFNLSIKVLNHIHKYGYAEYAKLILEEVGKEKPSIRELKHSNLQRLIPFGIQLFRHDEQGLYGGLLKELRYILADNKLTIKEKKKLSIRSKKVLSKVAAEQLEDEAREALYEFTEENSAVDTAFKGKVGIALSGGGFRASLYHIGVFAKMAELDVLRHVEAISCVSGGSIIGAYYYLELKKMLESKTDQEITRDDYINLVKRVEKGFLKCVQTNIRMRVLDDPIYNIKMFFSPKVTRSKRLADLYEKYFYWDIFNTGNKSKQREKIPMHQLRILPKLSHSDDEPVDQSFNIHLDNWRRKNKVPELILNATCLNTGHNWQFTASWMGEPSASIVSEVDAKFRLRRMYYKEAPEEFRDITLGEAVAASSGVPGVFEPLELNDLYPGIKVQLVDGGVHDNQGVVGLMERECKIFFVSDASGQILSQDTVSRGMLPVIMRTQEVLQGRIRESQYITLKSRNESALMKAMMFVHLRKDLSESPRNWKYCEDPAEFNKSALTGDKQADLTKYGIRTEVQKRLASVRTDLDSFNDIESYALMYSGYKMTELEHKSTTQKYFPEEYQPELGWKFLKIKEFAENVQKSKQLEEILDISSITTFKIFYLSKLWKYIGITLLSIIGIGLSYSLYNFWDTSISLGRVTIAFLIFMMPLVLGKMISYARNYKGSLQTIAQKITIAIFGALFAKLFVGYFNRRYNYFGSFPIKDRDYIANYYLGGLAILIGLFSWHYKHHVTKTIEAPLTKIKDYDIQVDLATHYGSAGLMIIGIGVFLYAIWTSLQRA